MTEISISKIVGHAILATIAWIVFGYTSRSFFHPHAPRANVIEGVHRTINGHDVTIVAPTEEEMKRADLSMPFMTREAFAAEMEHHQHRRVLMAVLALCSAFATFWYGSTMGDSWRYGVAAVLFGPLAVSYFMYRRAWTPW